MYIKLVGGSFLLVAALLSSISLCAYYRRRLDTLDGFISLIQYIKGQVDCYARPIDGILSALPPEILRDCNCPAGAGSLEEMIEESRLYLDRDSLRYVTAFAVEFGSIFREEQTRRCDHYVDRLRERRAAVAERQTMEMRSGCAIILSLSACILILLW